MNYRTDQQLLDRIQDRNPDHYQERVNHGSQFLCDGCGTIMDRGGIYHYNPLTEQRICSRDWQLLNKPQ